MSAERLYLGGAPGFRPGDVIEPHPTKHLDGCEWCASGADDSHRPDRVFATTFRLYAKFYASKYVLGTLYVVEPVGDIELSDNDPFESFHAPAMRVVRVVERAVELTMSERRRIWRLWTEADRLAGLTETNWLAVRQAERLMGITS